MLLLDKLCIVQILDVKRGQEDRRRMTSKQEGDPTRPLIGLLDAPAAHKSLFWDIGGHLVPSFGVQSSLKDLKQKTETNLSIRLQESNGSGSCHFRWTSTHAAKFYWS